MRPKLRTSSTRMAGPPCRRSIQLSIATPGAGWNLNVITTNFTFDAKSAGLENVEGHGHAHVYVNGVKLGRVYGAWHHIGALPLGENEVTVALYANDHSALTSGGVKITSTSTVIVEQ